MTDFDGDGMLDLILSHGESMAQPLSIFKSTQVSKGAPLGVSVPVSPQLSLSSLCCRVLATTGCGSCHAPALGPLREGPRWCCSHGAAVPTCASLMVAQGTCVRWSP